MKGELKEDTTNVYAIIQIDLNLFDEEDGIKCNKFFKRLSEQGLDRYTTIREIIQIFHEGIKNSTGEEQVNLRKKFALMSGRNPISLKNIVKYWQRKGASDQRDIKSIL
jgi:hypothetical protein